jgi:hypothetical protein
MKDLTGLLKKAQSIQTLWAINDFWSALELLRNTDYTVQYWEGDENWATVLKQNISVAFIWRKYPLFFVAVESFENIKQCLYEHEFIVYIEVDDFNKQQFTMDFMEFKYVMDIEGIPTHFSVDDLLFYTTSI